MPRFSKQSLDQLNTCHPALRRVMHLAIQRMDFSVIEGHRSKEDQNQAYKDGRSTVRWPDSNHNATPSRAVDIIPYPFNDSYWQERGIWALQAQVVLQCAKELGVSLRWGGDWDQDGDHQGERFFDGPHFELL